MAATLTYVVAKYVRDMLRQEPRNIGVFVFGQDGVAGRLIGENKNGQLNLRNVPNGIFNDGDVYAEWHAHWRKLLSQCRDAEVCRQDLIESAHGTFVVWPGGELFPESPDTPQDICDDLYSRLVRPLHPAMTTEEDLTEETDSRSIELAQEIAHVFHAHNILATRAGQTEALAPHPVQTDVRVRGTLAVPHLPKFVQENGRQFVMEQVDFTRSPTNGREHACYAAYMLGDILKAGTKSGRPVEAIAVVNRVHGAGRRGESKKLEAQRYGLGALEKSKIRIVQWDNQAQREEFVQERIKVAVSSQ